LNQQYYYYKTNLELFDKDGPVSYAVKLNIMHHVTVNVSESMLGTQEIKDLLQLKQFYDVALVEATYSDWILPVVNHVSKSMIYVMPTDIYAPYLWTMNIPSPYSFTPNVQGLGFSGNMNFFERVQNTLSHLHYVYYHLYVLIPEWKRIYESKLPGWPSNFLEAEKNISMVFAYRHLALDGSKPTMPFVKDIGGAHLRDANPLPKNIEEFVNGSREAGFIYVSLGTVPTNSVPKHATQALVEGFRRIPQRVLWAWKGDAAELHVPDNVMVLPWVPQQDILGHSKIRAMITHAGVYTLMECLSNGVPMITLPILWDQPVNAAKIAQRGLGINLQWAGLTGDKVKQALDAVINETRYKETVTKYQKIFLDNPHTAVEEAVFWTEYTIRHGGALHLRSQGDHLNFAQYLLLDVFAFIAAIILVALVAAYKIISIPYKYIYCRKEKDTKNNKKQQ